MKNKSNITVTKNGFIEKSTRRKSVSPLDIDVQENIKNQKRKLQFKIPLYIEIDVIFSHENKICPEGKKLFEIKLSGKKLTK